MTPVRAAHIAARTARRGTVGRWVSVSAVSSDFLVLDAGRRDAENVEQVRGYWEPRLGRVLADRPDLIVLPEVCDRPDNFEIGRRLEYYECRGDKLLCFFREAAREGRAYLVYPTERRDESGRWLNSAYLIGREGEICGIYDKVFVTLSQMEEGFACGLDARIFRCDFGSVGMAICFDLNFPELLEAYRRLTPDLILFPSHLHGAFLAEYWAYTCRAFLVGAIARNECYVISPAGCVVARSGPARRFVTARVNLDRCLVHCGEGELHRLDALKRARGPAVSIVEAGFMGAYLISSAAAGTSARAMALEAGLVLLEDHVSSLEAAACRYS